MVALAVSQSLATLEWLGGHFSPATLFATSEPGVWYDPSDVANTNWLYNLLTFTEQFDNAAWSKTGATIVANTATAPNETTTADLIREDTSTGPHRVFQTVAIPATTHAFSFYAKPAGRDWVWVYVNGGLESAFINVSTGAIGSVVGSPNISVTFAGNGWYRISLGFPNVTTATQNIQIWASSGNNTNSYTGDGTSGILVWGAQLELGSTATTYQPITTVAAETIARFPYATLYQDSAGTTPVTAPNQPVGLMLDKSQGLVLGPELVTNGDFSGGSTGWTVPAGWTITGGGAVATATNGSLLGGGVTTVSGRTYRVDFDVVSYTSGVLYITVGGNFSGNPSLTGAAMAAGRKTVYVTAGASSSRGVEFYGGTVTATIDNISVKLLPGNHATQSTSGSRPTYGIVPATGRRNLLQQTEVFTNAYWLTQGGSWSAVNSTGFQTFTEDTGLSQHRLYKENLGMTSGLAYTLSARVSYGTRQWVFLSIFDGTATVSGWFDLLNGIKGSVSASASTIMSTVAPGVYDISLTRTAAGTTANGNVQIGTQISDNASTSWTANGSSVNVSRYQFEQSATATAYQKVVSDFEVTEANVASLSYIFFDGINRFMVTPTITPGTNKVQVFAGVRKLSDVALGIVAELAVVSGASNPGSFFLAAPRTAATGDFAFNCGGSAFGTGAISANSFAAPTTRVMTGIGDISGDVVTLRIDGAQVATSASDQGTGNFLAYPMYIGRRGGTTLPFNGQMYGLITRFGANLNTSQLVSTEGWMNTKTRAY